MARKAQLIGPASASRSVAAEELSDAIRPFAHPVVFDAPGPAAERILARLLPQLPGLIATGSAARQEQRIEGLIGNLLDLDPFDRVEAEIDLDNARMRADFLQEFEMLDSAGVHDRAGHRGRNKAQTANGWKRAGRILALPVRGRDLFPAFQFDGQGQPLPLMAEVLAALPADLTPWQRAFWFAAPCPALDEALPMDLLARGDRRILDAAARAGELPPG